MPLDNTDSPLMFTVTEKPVLMEVQGQHIPTPGWKQLVRRHPVSGMPHVLYVCKDSYTIVQNKDLFAAADAAVRAFAGNHMTTAIIKDEISYLGARCFRQYVFPTISCELKQRRAGTSVMFRIMIFTAFDGSSSIKVLSGAIDGFCTNGMIFGEYNQLIQRHTASAKVLLPKLEEHLKASLAYFWTHAGMLSKWAEKAITIDQAETLLKGFFSDKRVSLLKDRFAEEAAVRGHTLWALYSALTYYASHNSTEFPVRSTGKDNVVATLKERELEVYRITGSQAWKELAK